MEIRQKAGAIVFAALLSLSCGRANREKYLARGNQDFQNFRYREALIDYRKALQSDPKFGEAYYGMGRTEFRLGHAVESLAALTRAADLMPQNDQVKELLGDLYLMRYQSDRSAAEAYAKVNAIAAQLLARNPRSFAGLRLKGYIALADGKPAQAVESFAQANQIRPLVPDVAVTLTQTLLVEGRAAEALALARDLIAAHPDTGAIYDTLYSHYVETGNFGEAERILILKAKNNPADPFPVTQLAEHYWQHGQHSQAEETIHSLLVDSTPGNPKRFPQAYMLIGNFYRHAGEAEEAVRAFDGGAAANPKEKFAYEKRALEVLIAAGKRQQALDRIQRLLAENGGGQEADELKGTRAGLWLASSVDSEREQALHDFEELARKAPQNTDWHFQLGRAYAGAGQLKAARQELETVVQQRPGYTPAWVALAEVASRSRDFAGCQRYAEEALARSPELPNAHLLHAQALVGLGQYNEARAEYDRLIGQNPGYREARLQRALLDVVEGRYSDAEKKFSADYDPAHRDFRALEGLIALYFSEGHPEKAFALLETQTARYPGSSELAAIDAGSDARAGKWNLAIGKYERLHAERPDDPGILLGLGDAYLHAGDFSRAIGPLERARMLRPADWRAAYLLGYSYQMAAKPREAEAAYRACLRLNPDYPAALNNLASLLADAQGGRLEEALALAEKAVRADGGNVEASDTLAWIYFKQNRVETARQLFSSLLAHHPENAILHYHYGLALRQKGDRARSDGELRAALDRGLSAPDRQAATRLLATN
jgi:tetratricopeptide (TPR) repeat protein